MPQISLFWVDEFVDFGEPPGWEASKTLRCHHRGWKIPYKNMALYSWENHRTK